MDWGTFSGRIVAKDVRVHPSSTINYVGPQASPPPLESDVLLVVADDAATTAGDDYLRDELEHTWGHVVTLVDDDDPEATLGDYDLVVVSPTATNVGSKYDEDADIPVFNLAASTWDDHELTDATAVATAHPSTLRPLNAVSATSPLTAGIHGSALLGAFDHLDPGGTTWSTDDTSVAAGALVGGVVDEDISEVVLFSVEAGSQLADSSNAPDRRAAFGLDDADLGSNLTGEAVKVLRNGVSWLLGLDADSDSDGVALALELIYGTNPASNDSDADGLTDQFEIELGGVDHDPRNADTDADLVGDAAEDVDADTLDAAAEQLNGTDPLDPDTDADGLDDATEVNGTTDPLDPDTDGDGVLDGIEIIVGTDPNDTDSDNDGTLDGDDTSVAPTQTGPDNVAVTVEGGPAVAGTLQIAELAGFTGTTGQVGSTYELDISEDVEDDFVSAEITIPYDEAEVPDAEADLRIFVWDDDLQVWLPAADVQTVDEVANEVTATVSHFSWYSIFDLEDWLSSFLGTSSTDPCPPSATGDQDSDGLLNCEESYLPDGRGSIFSSDTSIADTDAEGLSDHDEVGPRIQLESLNIGIITIPLDVFFYPVVSDPRDTDTDDDFLDDLAELAFGSDPRVDDTDGDGLDDSIERVYLLNPHHSDSDRDGRSDQYEFDRQFTQALDPARAETVYTWASWQRECVLGFIFGDFIELTSVPRLLCAVGSGFAGPIFDIRDFVANLARGELVGAGLALVGVIPLIGDSAKAIDAVRSFARRSPDGVAELAQAIERSPFPSSLKDELADALYAGAKARILAKAPSVPDEALASLRLSGRSLDELADALEGASDVVVDTGFLLDWKQGEQLLRASDPNFLPTGRGLPDPAALDGPRRYRVADAYMEVDDVITVLESKVGYVSMSPSIRRQITRDAALLDNDVVDSITWHFYPSANSDSVGAAESVLNLLRDARQGNNPIPYVIHMPNSGVGGT